MNAMQLRFNSHKFNVTYKFSTNYNSLAWVQLIWLEIELKRSQSASELPIES